MSKLSKSVPRILSITVLNVLVASVLQSCGGSSLGGSSGSVSGSSSATEAAAAAIDPLTDVCIEPVTPVVSGPPIAVLVSNVNNDKALPTTSSGMPVTTSEPTDPAAPRTGPIPTAQIDRSQWDGIDVVIPKGTTVTLDANVMPTSVTVFGTLRCSGDRDLTIAANWIIVVGGLLECGSEASPYSKKLVITLKGAPSEESVMGLGTKVLGAVDGGQINLIGVARKSWVKLASNAQIGTSELQLAQAVDWKAGDRIVIASSVVADQSEEREIEQVVGSKVKLKTALNYSHTGEMRQVAGVDLDLRAEVGLLTQDIRIEGDETSVDSQFGGHVMIARLRSNARMQGVQFTRMGQFNRLGRYPMHWHHVRDASGGFFRNNSISHTIQRGVFVHATDNLRVERNVVYGTKGHSFGLENGSETGNVFIGNLGLGTRGATLPKVKFENGDLADDDQAATFWFVGGNNTFTGNVAAGSEHSGFWFERSGNVKTFDDNVAHSNAAGDRPGANEQGGITTKDSRGLKSVFKNTLLYSNAVGAWFESLNSVLLDSKLVDNRMATFSAVSMENTIVIGDSNARTGNPQGNNEGLVTYTSPVVAKNVTFANFSGYAMRTFLGGPEGANFTTEGLKFVNVTDTKRIMLQIGNSYAQDLDGSLVGRPAVLTSNEPSMYTTECVAKQEWSVHICPPTLYQYQAVFNIGEKFDTLTRDDGVQQSLGTSVPFFNVIAGRKYTLSRDQGSFNVWVGGANSFVELIFPATNARFDIFECAYVGGCTDESRKLTPVATQSELDQSTGNRYFYDATAGQLHLKVGRERQIVVKRL
jgi:G8 domain